MHAHEHHEEFDQFGHEHHGHKIVNPLVLLAVFFALLFFTVLTVAAAKAEGWVATTFQVDIPMWVNVTVCMSIAVMKTTLVTMYFMQLRYDNPQNTMVLVFTILTVLFFLLFTALDLGNRGSINRYQGEYIQAGGLGLGGSEPITKVARETAILQRNPLVHPLHGHGEEHAGPTRSSADFSRPVRGLTLPGFAPAAAPALDEEHGAHGETPHQEPAPQGH